MVSVAQLVERQVVALLVAGSSPVTHPLIENWRHRLVVRTPRFQCGNRGSTPRGATNYFSGI